MSSNLICPVCQGLLTAEEKAMTCCNNHCFDRAKSGYVNLLLSQKTKTKQHGDDKLMANARRDFLNKGYYKELSDAICKMVVETVGSADNAVNIVDAGCGECYYTSNMLVALAETGKTDINIVGIDISKESLVIGAKRCKELELAVASVFHMPIQADSTDILISVFAPYCGEEFNRILKPNGVMIMVIPLERHLMHLKQVVYDKPYENEVDDLQLEGFNLVQTVEIRSKINLSTNKDIQNLFTMTPYFYKTGESDKAKLDDVNELTTEIEFMILKYKNKKES